MLKGKNALGISLHSRRRMFESSAGRGTRAGAPRGDHDRTIRSHYMGLDGLCVPPPRAQVEIIGGLFGPPYRVARCGVADLEVRPAPSS